MQQEDQSLQLRSDDLTNMVSSPNRPQMMVISLFAGLVYFLSNPKPNHFYDYTFRVAGNFLEGKIAFIQRPPDWLNEFVLFEGAYYSVFPLGSVLSMLPFAVLEKIGLINEMPSSLIAGLLISGICMFLLLIGRHYRLTLAKSLLTTSVFLFGTWVWANTVFGGAWQLALVFAMLGSIGSIYFTLFNRKPFLAGLFFAIGFGNRTEILLTAPILMYLLTMEPYVVPAKAEVIEYDPGDEGGDEESAQVDSIEGNEDEGQFGGYEKPSVSNETHREAETFLLRVLNSKLQLINFCIIPFILGVSTLFYNYSRFHSFTDFGYARIPGVLDEPWYRYGIFSVWYIPNQIYEMLFKLWEVKDAFPYYIPNGFSSSILISSPFVLLALRFGAKNMSLKWLSWLAILLLCIILWMHGNAGGWQFGYRYATVCLPWLYLILLENSDEELSWLEAALFAISIIISGYGMWLFNWTEYVRP